ncbi:MAG: SUMF1/EgtB/PvdO family nonheme iron enzyme [Myxococcales bacterium]|nr:SUMF1/EgtB/PvdO family nonheme iron enzyme [Myxococcales bacterium]
METRELMICCAVRTSSLPLFALVTLAVGCGGSSESPRPLPSPEGPAPSAKEAAPAAASSDAAPAAPPTSASASASAAAPAAPPPECPEGMVKVAGGSFKFGLLKKDVTVGDLCVDKTEVTAGSYEACVKDGKCTDSFLDCAEAKTFKIPGKENHPIVCVDYPQAKSYCDYVGKRLPTEEEWEWIARAGAEGRKYAYGNDPPKDEICWSGSPEGARKGTCAVGSYPKSNSPQGIVDLTGNVFEWTSTQADGSGKILITKGGTWRDGVATQMLITRPGGFKPEYRCGFGGMRCVKPK